MGSIKSGLFISLDGVTEAPDTWHFGYFNEEMGNAVGSLMAGNDAMLLGRRTYDEFAGYWPNADANDPITKQMNGTPKYVVSNTLTQADWENTTVVGGDDVYDQTGVGFVSNVPAENGRIFFRYDTAIPGNGNGGHLYGTTLPDDEKRAIVEYMKKF